MTTARRPSLQSSNYPRRRLVYTCETASDGHSLGVARPIRLARIAAENGWRPILVAAVRQADAAPVTVLRRDGVIMIQYRSPFRRNVGVRRALNMMAFGIRSLLLVRRGIQAQDNDVVITSSTGGFDCLAGFLARFRGAAWVVETRDVWPDAPRQLRPGLRSYGVFGLSSLARRLAYRFANAFMSPLENQAAHIDQRGGLRGREFLHLPNCASLASSRSLARAQFPVTSPEGLAVQETIAELRRQSGVVIGYFGSMNTANGVDRLVELTSRLDPAEAAAVFVGQGELLPGIRQRGEKLAHLRFHVAVPPDECQALMRQVDILIFGIPPLPVYRYGLSPIKLGEYLCAGKPIFYWGTRLNLGAAQGRAGRGGDAVVVVDAESVEVALERLQALIREDAGRRELRGARAVEVAASTFSYSNYAAPFMKFLESLERVESARSALPSPGES